jgi:hypothetical protein
MKANPVDLATPLGRGDHVDYDGAFVEKPEYCSSASVGNNCTRTSKGGRAKPSSAPNLPMSHGVDAAENSMQACGGDFAADYRVAHPETPQLVTRDHPELFVGELGERSLAIGVPFGSHAPIRHTAEEFAPLALERCGL